MINTITKHSFYAAWEYEKEELDLNEASRKGLQLIRGGCFRSKFQSDNSVRYIYQLDYNAKIGDPLRYREVFEEQGWEYINSTFNGWHYFRKIYKEGMEESDTQIYTDRQSLHEMQNRWLRLVTIVDVLYIASTLLYLIYGISSGVISIIVEGALFALLALTFTSGIIHARRKRAGKKGGFIIPIRIVFPFTIVMLIGIFVLNFWGWDKIVVHDESFTCIGKVEDELPETFGAFTIDKSGRYDVNLSLHMDDGTMTVKMKDDSGNVVYTEEAGDCRINGYELELEEGSYQAFYTYEFQDYDAAESEVSAKLEICK